MPNIFWAAFGGGAAVGLFGLIVAFIIWLRWYRHRPLVCVKVSWAYFWDILGPDPLRHIFLTASNPHSKPVILKAIGFELKDSGDAIQITKTEPYPLPHELLGGQSFMTLCPESEILQLLRTINHMPRELRYAFFTTQTGKRYRCKLSKKFAKNLQIIFDEKIQ